MSSGLQRRVAWSKPDFSEEHQLNFLSASVHVFLGLFFVSEHGSDDSPETPIDFHRAKRRCIPEGKTNFFLLTAVSTSNPKTM
jgi:hypothetical protein